MIQENRDRHRRHEEKKSKKTKSFRKVSPHESGDKVRDNKSMERKPAE